LQNIYWICVKVGYSSSGMYFIILFSLRPIISALLAFKSCSMISALLGMGSPSSSRLYYFLYSPNAIITCLHNLCEGYICNFWVTLISVTNPRSAFILGGGNCGPVRWSELWLNLAETHCSGWIVVREKYCSGWKNKPNKPNLRQANGGLNNVAVTSSLYDDLPLVAVSTSS